LLKTQFTPPLANLVRQLLIIDVGIFLSHLEARICVHLHRVKDWVNSEIMVSVSHWILIFEAEFPQTTL